MSTIDENTLRSLGISTQSSNSAANSRKLGQDQFLELMIAQLRNQDPLKPMQNGEFLGQMAQFSTVSGIQDLQSSFSQLSSALTSNQALQATSLVGRTVLMDAPVNAGGNAEVGFTGSTMVQGALELDAPAETLLVDIFDGSGALVRRLRVDQHFDAGMVPFEWDGTADDGSTLPAGVYQVKAQSLRGNEARAVNVLVADTVSSVTLGRNGEGLTLNLAQLGKHSLSDVRQVA